MNFPSPEEKFEYELCEWGKSEIIWPESKLATLFALLGNPLLIPPDATSGAVQKPSIHFLVWLDTVPLGTGYHSQLLVTKVLDGAYLLRLAEQPFLVAPRPSQSGRKGGNQERRKL